jgi:hypothetical protein
MSAVSVHFQLILDLCSNESADRTSLAQENIGKTFELLLITA